MCKNRLRGKLGGSFIRLRKENTPGQSHCKSQQLPREKKSHATTLKTTEKSATYSDSHMAGRKARAEKGNNVPETAA